LHKLALAGICCVLLFVSTSAQNKADYVKSVEPIIEEKCITCHNHTMRSGGLSLESFEALMNGGKRGAEVVAGNSSQSRLAQMIEGVAEPRMPLGGQLTPTEIKTIKNWIDGLAEPAPSPLPDKNSSVAPPVIKPTVPVKASATSLAFSRDGSVLAVGKYREVELLDPTNNHSVATLAGHASQVRSLAFSPDGRLLAAAGGNPAQFGEVKIWRVADRTEVRTLRGHRDNIFAVAFSPDGTRLATSSYDRLIKLWDVATGTETKTLKDHTDAVFSLAFSSDGKRLASASADRTVKVWDTATGERLFTLGDALDGLNTVSFHPSGKFLAAAGADRTIRIWRLGATDGKQVRSLIAHEDAINQLAYSPDGTILVSAGADKLVKLWEAATLTEIRTLEPQSDWVFAVIFSPDGKRLTVGRYDGSIATYECSSGKRLY
jgi:WD40 repeat protein